MKIVHLDSEIKPYFIDVYIFQPISEIALHYLSKDWVKKRKYLVGKWNIKYKTND